MCLFSTFTIAQKAVFQGIVTDKANNEPLIGATILYGSGNGSVTDFDGNFIIELDPGTYNFVLSYTGYEKIEFSLTLAEGQKVQQNYSLQAADNILSTATVTGSKVERSLGEVTVTLDIMKPRLIENTAATGVDKVLDKIPGVDMIDGQANIRGGSGFSSGTGSRVMLLIDDIPALQGDLGLPQWGDVPVEMVDQMEVVKGAASSLYGSAALNGIVNVRTISPKTTPVTKFSSFYTGYFAPRSLYVTDTANNTVDTFNNKWWDQNPPFEAGFQFAHAKRIKRFGYVIGGNILQNRGFVKDTYSRRYRFNAKLQYNITERFIIGLNAFVNTGADAYFFFWKDSYSGQFEGNTTGPAASYIQGHNLRFTIDPYMSFYDLKGNRHRLQGRIYKVDNNNTNGQSNAHTLYYGEYQFQGRMERIGKLSIVSGIASQYVDAKGEVLGDFRHKQLNVAPYLQLEGKPVKGLSLNAGVRFEYNYQTSPDSIIAPGPVSPFTGISFGTYTIANPVTGAINDGRTVFRAGASYELAKATFIRASWGQGYRFPTLGEKYIFTSTGGNNVFPNPQLTPETGWSSELGVKQGFKIDEWQGFVDVAGFYQSYENMTEFTFSGAQDSFFLGIQSINVGATNIWGAEASITGSGKVLGGVLNLLTGYTFIEPKYKNFGTFEQNLTYPNDKNLLKYRFQHSFKIDAEMNYTKLSGGISVQYRSRITGVDPFFNAAVSNFLNWFDRFNNGYLVCDARLAYSVNQNVKVSVVGRNVFNALYVIRPAKPEAPANLTVRLDVNL